MTQTPPVPPAKRPPRSPQPIKFEPTPGTVVRLKGTEETGTVRVTDEWLDTLLVRGKDIADQTLVEWSRNGHPVYRWEITSQLEAAPVDTTVSA